MEINSNEKESVSKSDKTTNRLVFAPGRSNPLLFLNDFEKCNDIKNDQGKMYKIRNFVDDCHKGKINFIHSLVNHSYLHFIVKLNSADFTSPAIGKPYDQFF